MRVWWVWLVSMPHPPPPLLLWYLQILADKSGFEIVVVNPTMTDQDDLMQDFASIITSFCARLYSRRRAKRQTEKIVQTLNQEEPHATSGAAPR